MNPFKYDVIMYAKGVGLEISPAKEKMFPHFIHITKEEIQLFKKHSMDYVVFRTESTKDSEVTETFNELWSVLKPGGFFNFIINKESPVSCVQKVKGWIKKESLSSDSHLYMSLKKTSDGLQRVEEIPTKKTACVVRYGGIGDMMMCAFVFKELQNQGYHVTLVTHPSSFNVVRHDPNIDRAIVQNPSQVPPYEFRDFILHTSQKYDKFINLSESIEGTLLALPDRVSYYWPTKARHEIMDRCYYETTAMISEVPFSKTGKFYRTELEKVTAKKRRKKMGKGPLIIWVLSGSSTHKVYPRQDTIIARILLQHPTATVVLVGDDTCKLLSQGWENEPRVIVKAGVWKPRDTMSLCYEADLIVTPETGVGLGVQHNEKVAKIWLLSHSSPKNYSKIDNVTFLHTEECDCYPCHQLHYGYEYCNIDEESHCAMCQVTLDPDKVTQTINKILGD